MTVKANYLVHPFLQPYRLAVLLLLVLTVERVTGLNCIPYTPITCILASEMRAYDHVLIYHVCNFVHPQVAQLMAQSMVEQVQELQSLETPPTSAMSNGTAGLVSDWSEQRLACLRRCASVWHDMEKDVS